MESKKEILFISLSGPVIFEKDSLFFQMFRCLSKRFKGYIISHVMKSSDLKIDKVGCFKTCLFTYKWNFFRRIIYSCLKTIKEGLKIWRKCKYEVIICRDPLTSAFCGIILKKFTKAKLVVEVRGILKDMFKHNKRSINFLDRLKIKISKKLIYLIFKNADLIKLLYKNQLFPYKLPEEKIIFFPDFVETKSFEEIKTDDQKYILFVGGPWYIKGLDILIKAFNIISNKFSEYKLKVFGWTWQADKDYFFSLAKDNSKIEIYGPISRKEVARYMANCSLFVLPSRTESMGRVIVEAMICKKPVVASNAGGIPYIIKHGYNGLLFEKENVKDLAKKLETILTNKDLAKKLSQNAYEYAKNNLTEKHFLLNFQRMIDKACKS